MSRQIASPTDARRQWRWRSVLWSAVGGAVGFVIAFLVVLSVGIAIPGPVPNDPDTQVTGHVTVLGFSVHEEHGTFAEVSQSRWAAWLVLTIMAVLSAMGALAFFLIHSLAVPQSAPRLGEPSMSSRAMALRTLGGILGLALLLLLFGYGLGIRLPSPDAAAPRQEMVEILVAAKDLKEGTVITDPESLFKRKKIPLDAKPRLAVSDPALLRGRKLRISLIEDQHVSLSCLEPDDVKGRLPP